MSRKYKILSCLALILIFSLLRIHTFTLSHTNNDELIYVSLAKKIQSYGLTTFQGHYNLFYIDIEEEKYNGFLSISLSKEEKASLIRDFQGAEASKFSHHPPLLSILLAISHNLFKSDIPYALAKRTVNALEAKNQFYACIIPFTSSLLLALFTFVLGSMLFSFRLGILASLLIIFNPTDLLTAHKIWADDLVSLFGLLSIISYELSIRKYKLIYSLLAGVLSGLSIMSKMSGVIFILVVIVLHFIEARPKEKKYKIIFDKRLIVFLISVILTSMPWLYLFLKNQGGLKVLYWGFEPITNKVKSLPVGFLSLVYNRPWYIYFVSLIYQMPIFIFGYLGVLRAIIKKIDSEKIRELTFLSMWFLLVIFILTLRQDREERYLLIAMPALSILSAKFFLQFINRGRLIRILLLFFLALCFFWAATLGLDAVFTKSDLIPIIFLEY
ncbi:MAG: phospholipid carrier-dependent glycosyltransferase [Candidatus Omnitrophota bacterium]